MLRRALAAGVVLGVLVGACGAEESGAPRPVRFGGGEEARIAAELRADGTAVLPDPPAVAMTEEGLRSAAIGAGSRVVFFGRSSEERAEGRRFRRNSSEAWELDTTSGAWRRLPEPPLEYPLERLGMAGFWTGREVVIVGTPCARVHLDEEVGDEPTACSEGGPLSAVAWSPGTERWRALGSPPAPVLPERYASSRRPRAVHLFPVGWTGREVVMWPSDAARERALLLLDPVTARWRWSEPVPARISPSSICLSEGRVVGVPIGGALGSGVLASEDRPEPQVRAYVLDEASLAWEPGPAVPRDTGRTSPQMFWEEVVCPYPPDAAAVYVGAPFLAGEAPLTLLRLDVAGGRWEPLPPMPGLAVPRAREVRIGEQQRVYVVVDRGSGREVLVVPTPDGGGWREVPPFLGPTFGSLIPLDGARFVLPGRRWRQWDTRTQAPPEALLVDLGTWVERHLPQ